MANIQDFTLLSKP